MTQEYLDVFGHAVDNYSTNCLECKYRHTVEFFNMSWLEYYGVLWADYLPHNGCVGTCSENYMNKNFVYMGKSDPRNWTFERECNGKEKT